MIEPMIVCRWCNGKGKRNLAQPVLRVFKIIYRMKSATCPQIFAEINGDYQDRTIANQYVKRLVELGLVKKLAPAPGTQAPRYCVA